MADKVVSPGETGLVGVGPPPVAAPRALLRAINAWLESQRGAGTNDTYNDALNRVLAIVPTSRLASLTPEDAVSVVTALQDRHAPATVNLTLSAMRTLWRRYLLPAGVATCDPWANIRLRHAPRRTGERVLTRDEMQRLLSAIPQGRDRALIHTAYRTGLRVRELTTIRWSDLRREGKRTLLTFVGKGGKERTVGVPPDLLAELEALPRFGERIFPIGTGHAWRIVRRWSSLVLGRPASPHWLRHTHATQAIRHGAPLHVVQHSLGHASLATTGVYLQVEPGETSADYLGTGLADGRGVAPAGGHGGVRPGENPPARRANRPGRV